MYTKLSMYYIILLSVNVIYFQVMNLCARPYTFRYIYIRLLYQHLNCSFPLQPPYIVCDVLIEDGLYFFTGNLEYIVWIRIYY